MEMDFELLGDVENIEPIAVNLSIRERKSLKSPFSGDVVGGSSEVRQWSGFPTVKSAAQKYIGMRLTAWADAR